MECKTEVDEKGTWNVKVTANGVKVRSLVKPAPECAVPGVPGMDILSVARNIGAEVDELKGKVAELEGKVATLETGGARPIS